MTLMGKKRDPNQPRKQLTRRTPLNGPRLTQEPRKLDKRPQGTKSPKRKTVKAYLDLIFAKTVRMEYIDANGEWCLFCHLRQGCPPAEPISDAFHFWSRSHEMTRWDRRNVPIATCRKCNLAYESDAGFCSRMIQWFKETYGTEVWDALEKAWHTTTDLSTDDLISEVEKYDPRKAAWFRRNETKDAE